jgi:urea transport system ATP-binding protein
MLTITGLNQFYGGSHTLWDVNLTVPKGSRTCVIGRNGMGKTTLLKCIMGLLPVTSGEICFDGTPITHRPVENRARSGVGYVPQGREIFPQLTVEENLRIGLGVRGNGPKDVPANIFDLFPVLKQMLRRRGGDLSGGLELNNRSGLTVLIVEQKLPFARRVANDFVVLDKGRCARRGAIEDLTDDIVRAHLSV